VSQNQRDPTPIRVAAVDDHAVVLRGLEQLLATATGIEVAGTARSGEEALELVSERHPDVVLLDLSMSGMDGIEATRRILAIEPDVRVVILTSFSDQARILEALVAGAIGYLLKDAEPRDLLNGIRAAARGEAPLAPRAASAVLAARRGGQPADSLSDREREVLVLAASGLVNKQIARRLGIAEKTVKAHLTSVFRRIGVADRTQAALWAERQGLLRSDPTGTREGPTGS
jgi:DNA-binding NarL/FixJ family response regulator